MRIALRAIVAVGTLALATEVLPGPPSAQAPSVQSLADALFGQLARLRGAASPGPPPSVVIGSRADTRRHVEQELDRKYPARRVEAEQKALVAWGLVPAHFNLRRLLIDLLEEQAAAYYDPLGKTIVLADWLTPEQQQLALMHELVHALQDRHVSLDHFLTPTPGKGDELLARQALVEGEAMLLALEALLNAQGLDLAQLQRLPGLQDLVSAQAAGPVLDRAPPFVKDLLLFPYIRGLLFLHELRLQHPRSLVTQLYENPPRSTAQILHPEKLVGRREDPVPVVLPDLHRILGPRWQWVIEDGLGEWVLGAVLELHQQTAAARSLAAGWRGDRYQVWEAPTGMLLVYRVTWQTPRNAEVFAQAYARIVEKKFPRLAGRAAKGPTSVWSWRDGPLSFLVERRGLDVVLLEGIPSPSVESLRQALWQPASTAPVR